MSTALYWIAEFLNFAQDVMLPFTPRLIPAILPNLAHHAPMIQQQALRTNSLLLNVIQNLPTSPSGASGVPDKDQVSIASTKTGSSTASSPPNTSGSTNQSSATKTPTQSKEAELVPDVTASPASDRTVQMQMPARVRSTTAPSLGDVLHHASMIDLSDAGTQASRSQSPTPTATSILPNQNTGQQPQQNQVLTQSPVQIEQEPFDYRETVNKLTVQFLSEHEETRVAALKWLIMLHQKVPKKVSV